MARTPIAKILPPRRPSGSLGRPALDGLLSTVLDRRLTVVIAEAGFGKSTLLSGWWDAIPCAWYTADAEDGDMATLARQLTESLRLRVPDLPDDLSRIAEGTGGPGPEQLARADALGARLAEVLQHELSSDLLLVIDDADALPSPGPSARLVEAICRHAPPSLHLVLAGRRRAPFPVERLRGQGHLLEITGSTLTFSPDEVAEVLHAHVPGAGREVADELHQRVAGWPAAVVLAVEALRASPREQWAAVIASLDRPGAPLFAYLAEEVFARQPRSVRTLVGAMALFDHVTVEMCEALGLRGARALLDDLVRQGLFVERRQEGHLTLRPLIRDYAREHLAVPRGEAERLRTTAAEWYRTAGDRLEALRIVQQSGSPERLAAMVAEDGPDLLAAGHVPDVLAACRAVPDARRTHDLDVLEGEAQQIRGDWTAALACFERAAAGRDVLPANLAWRIGLIHYLRGEPNVALDVYRRGLADAGAAPAELALLLAWTATAHWLLGDVDPCRAMAGRALAQALACADGRALAAAHTVMAMLAALDGDRRGNDAHYLLALRAAEDAGDALQTVRIRTNRASHFMEEGSYAEALQELDAAVRLGELTSFASFLALALSNRGETRLRTGRLDEALADLEASRARYQHIGSEMIAYP